MADSRDLRLLAASAQVDVVAAVERRLREVLSPGSAERRDDPDAVLELERAVARSGRNARGRRAVAGPVAYSWFVRLLLLNFVHVRGWGERPQDAAHATTLWQELCRRVPALADEPEHLALLAPGSLFAPAGLGDRLHDALRNDGCTRVEVVGWMHQHWFGEHRRSTYANLSSTRADVAELGAVTQVFTPDWVARTLLDNSLGRLLPGGAELPYSVAAALPCEPPAGAGRSGRGPSVLDPACGTGHLLTHAFDLLLSPERTEQPGQPGPGQTSPEPQRSRVETILREQLVGFDVDPRVVRLASFVLTVKAWDALGGPVEGLPAPRVHTLQAVRFTRDELRTLRRLAPTAEWNVFADADVLGSLTRVDATSYPEPGVVAAAEPGLQERARQVLAQVGWLTERHDVVVANPPYLGTRHMGDRLRALAARDYPDTKGDLCTMFLERTLELCRPGGLAAVVASESWCVTTRTRRVRDRVLAAGQLRVAVHVDAAAFGVRVNTVVSVLENGGEAAPVAFARVGRHDLAAGAPVALPVPGRDVVHRDLADFDQVPDRVLAFDLAPALLALYAKGSLLGDVVDLRQGMATTDNARFLRRWWEVPPEEIVRDHRRGASTDARWVPYNKGGSAVRWWGNQEYVVLWEDDARELREVRPASAVEDRDFFRGSVSWSNIGRNGVQFRQYPDGFVFDVAGMSAFADDERTQLNLLGWLNSPLVRAGVDVLAPTLNYQVGDVARLPAPDLTAGTDHERVAELVRLTRDLWRQEPTSWEYAGHPVLLRPEARLDERARAHVRERDAVVARIRHLEQESADHWADVVEHLTGLPVFDRDPGPPTHRPTLTAQEYLRQALLEQEHGPAALR